MTTDERLQMLEREFARAKNRNRLLIGVLLLFGGVALVGGAARPAKEVRASKFVLVDETGRTRATLGMDKGAPVLALLDENSKERVVFRHYNLRMAGARATDAFLEPDRLLFRVDDEDARRRASLRLGLCTKMGEPSLLLRSRNDGCAWLSVEAENGPNLRLFRGHPVFDTFDRVPREAIGTEDESKLMRGFLGALIEATENYDKSTVMLNLGKDDSGLRIADKNGNPRAALVAVGGDPVLTLVGENHKPRVMLRAKEDGSALSLFDKNATGCFNVTVDKNGPCLRLYDENRKPRVILDADEYGPALHLYDENGKDRVALSAYEVGPALRLRDENGKGRVALGGTQTKTPDGKTITFPESSLLLFGPDGNVRWSAP